MNNYTSNRIVVGHENASTIEIFYKDWGNGQPIIFSHGWPLNADAWDEQLVFFADRGYRTIAHDRRGHGRSSQPWNGNDMDTYADDLAKIIEVLDLKNVILVGHSTGGGEICRYLARHGSARVSKMVLVGAVPPFMLQTETNPDGLPLSVFDNIRSAVATDRSQFYMDLTLPFYNYNRPNAQVSEGVREAFRIQGMQLGLRGALECIQAFSATDFSEDLKKIEIPVLLLHGADDQVVPAKLSAVPAAAMLKNSTLKLYPGGSHGLVVTQRDEFHADVLQFIKS